MVRAGDDVLCVKGRCEEHLKAGEWYGQACVFKKMAAPVKTTGGRRLQRNGLSWELTGSDHSSRWRGGRGNTLGPRWFGARKEALLQFVFNEKHNQP